MRKKIICIILCLISSFAFAHNDNGYYHNEGDLSAQKNWMSRLSDNISLFRISMPGTHDSGARYGGDSAMTQTLTIRQQLNAGIRFLDIRLRHIDNAFTIHHGIIYQKINFDDVLTQIQAFLKENPSETVLMRVKKEHDTKNCTRSFEDTFNQRYYTNYKQMIYVYSPKGSSSFIPPTLKEARGKLVFLQDFDATDPPDPKNYGNNVRRFGLHYDKFDIQDEYHVATNWDLYGKWEKVKKQLENANKNKASTASHGYMNYLTASGGSFPYFIASGHSNPATGASRLSTGLTTPGWKNSYPDFPRVNCFIGICTIAFEGTNTLAKNYINNKKLQYVGIVIADFPGEGLISAIINTNFR